jgi:hypothetical protein
MLYISPKCSFGFTPMLQAERRKVKINRIELTLIFNFMPPLYLRDVPHWRKFQKYDYTLKDLILKLNWVLIFAYNLGARNMKYQQK